MASGGLERVDDELGVGARTVRSAMAWAQVKALVADGVLQTWIAERLGISRRTVGRLLAEPRLRVTSVRGQVLASLLARYFGGWVRIVERSVRASSRRE